MHTGAYRRGRIVLPVVLLLAAALGAAGVFVVVLRYAAVGPPPPATDPPPAEAAEVEQSIHAFCGACHAYPPPDTFPRDAWEDEVKQGFGFFEASDLTIQPPPFNAVVKHYKDRAPEELPPAVIERCVDPLPVRLTPSSPPGPPGASPPAVSNVNLVHLFSDDRLDLLATDMRHGLVMALKPYDAAPAWRVLYRTGPEKGFNPAHAEVVDLDGDGRKDVLVANLGSFPPTDRRCGSVVWLRQTPDGSFSPVTLLEDVGRVADVQAADFRGTGKLDLVVAEFGWQKSGKIWFLENQTTDWDHPRFERHVLDERHGTIHVPWRDIHGKVCDLNHDGRPDFVALISQEHETVVAFLNEGGGRFRKETLYTAPHPAWGSSGIQLADLNGDGELDVLYTNGDTLDQPYLLKPYHSVQWLENPGPGKYPWIHHQLTPMYGVHRAVAVDLSGDGKLDVVACCFLPAAAFPQRVEKKLDAVIVLRQTAPGVFVRHTLETVTCDHVTCVAGDVYGTGRADLVIGNYVGSGEAPPVTIWRNEGKAEKGD
jgi:hypothetical protein